MAKSGIRRRKFNAQNLPNDIRGLSRFNALSLLFNKRKVVMLALHYHLPLGEIIRILKEIGKVKKI